MITYARQYVTNSKNYCMYQHLGILGGISHVSTGAYYERIVTQFQMKSPDGSYPEITIASLDFGRFTDYETEDSRAQYIDYIIAGLERLHGAGAGLALIAANSPHAVFEDVQLRSPLPLISIVEPTVVAAAERGLDRLLLLGIEFTMQNTFYHNAALGRAIEVRSPNTNHQAEVEAIIFDELCRNDIRDSSRERLLDIIDSYDVEGVILGCTELPLLISDSDSPVPVLDTMALHCETAVNLCLGREQETI
jgi:aspartate racemase